MQQEDDLRALAKIMEFGRAVSIFLLVVHVYVYCYPSITAWHLNLEVIDRILINFNNTTGIFNCILWSKLSAVLLLAVSCLGTHGVKGEKITWPKIYAALVAGCALFFLNWWLLELPLPHMANTAFYIFTLTAGYLALLMSGLWMSRIYRHNLMEDVFNMENESFMQETRLMENEYSVNLPTRFYYKKRWNNGFVNIVNIFRACMVIGTPGSGKSYAIVNSYMCDGLGDTIRVSLSEAPEAEIPVARKLVDYVLKREGHPYIPATEAPEFNYTHPSRRETVAIGNIGGDQLPVVISARLNNDLEVSEQFKPDYLYCGQRLPENRRADIGYIVDACAWEGSEHTYPAFNYQQLIELHHHPAKMKFLFTSYLGLNEEVMACLRLHPEVVIVAQSNHYNRLGEFRALAHQLMNQGLKNPLVFFQLYQETETEDLQIKSAADMGALIIDGLCDGILLYNHGNQISNLKVDETAFGILQAGRIRTSKTEYISCPGCGRTLYDLESTIARIKAATAHLKGLKIGIMGCIVNGPGEMADADYGYVGAGRGKISLYKKKECIEKNIPEEQAVEKLIELIKANGDYKD